jgi:hypothetical protein
MGGNLSSFPVAVLPLLLLYIVAGIASLPHPAIFYSVIPSLSVILRERSDRRITLTINSAKNLVFVFRRNPAKQFEE